MTDRRGERPEGWWLASDGKWYPPQPPKLPDPPGYRRRVVEMSLALVAWAATAVAYLVEHNAQVAARTDCPLYRQTGIYCSEPALNWTIGLAIVAGIITIVAAANVWQAKRSA